MFNPKSGRGIRSICIWCRYHRILQEHVARRTSQPWMVHQSRKISESARQSQEASQSMMSESDVENSVKATLYSGETRPLPPENTRQLYRSRSLKLFRKDSLGVDSLGRPAEALIIRDKPDRPPTMTLLSRDMEESPSEENIQLSASDIFEKISAEKGTPGAERVAKNLEDIRRAWTSSLRDKEFPTLDEYKALVKQLYTGFMLRQLEQFYGPELSSPTSNPDDLSAYYTCNLYSRSSWIAGNTFDPRYLDGSPVLIDEKGWKHHNDRFDETGKIEKKFSDDQLQAKRSKTSRKMVMIEKILRNQWHIRTQEEAEAVGELEIWPSRERIQVLVNHSEQSPVQCFFRYGLNSLDQDIFRQVSDRYGAEVIGSAPDRCIRIRADRATSADILKFVVYMLGRVTHRDVRLPPDPNTRKNSRNVAPRRARLLSPEYREQLQKMTNTLIVVGSAPSMMSPANFDEVSETCKLLGYSDTKIGDHPLSGSRRGRFRRCAESYPPVPSTCGTASRSREVCSKFPEHLNRAGTH